MAFEPIAPQRRGRKRIPNRVVAEPCGDARTLRLVLSADISRRLAISKDGARVDLKLGTGEDHGRMLLQRSETRDNGCFFFAARAADRYGAVLRTAAINRRAPERTTELPHSWREGILIVDLTPLPEFS